MAQQTLQQQRMLLSSSVAVALVSSFIGGIVIGWWCNRLRTIRQNDGVTETTETTAATIAYEQLIGKTPCVLLPNISRIIQRQIYIKCEQYNPSHSGKDRASYSMIRTAIEQQQLPPPKQEQKYSIQKRDISKIIIGTTDSNQTSANDTNTTKESHFPYDNMLLQVYEQSITGGIIIEGTSGSTGISLAHLAIAKGYGCIVVIPDDQASSEKQQLLQAIVGTHLHIVAPASISSPNHYVNIARAITQRAVQLGIQAVFIDQFNNMSNFNIHYTTTGPEIWEQCHPLHAFVMSAGTGGTISGVAKYIKERDPYCHVVLADPIGSVLFGKIEHGVAYTIQQQERNLLRHRYDSIAEGIGLDRITDNINIGLPYINMAMTITDQEIVNMAHYILREEGLMIGSSSAINIIAAIRTATQQLPIGSRICTVLCDSGQRHITRFWNREFIVARQLSWPQDNIEQHIPECLHDFVTKA